MNAFASAFALMLTAALLAGCAGQGFDVNRAETVLPLKRAWVDGRTVDYITTDVSDAVMARAEGANYAPRLAGAVDITGKASILERVYMFPGGEQINIFQSAPVPTGATNTVAAYSPLWRLVVVRWQVPVMGRVLKSEEELLAAEERGDVALEQTEVVVNCPVTRGTDGRALRGVR